MRNEGQHKAVVLGTNYYIGLSLIRCLGSEGVHVVAADYSEKNRYGAQSKYLSEKLTGPDYKTDPEGFLRVLKSYAKRQEKKPVLFPSADQYVEFMDTYFNELKEDFLFPMDQKGVWTQVMDKFSMSELAQKHHLLIPETLDSHVDNLLPRVHEEIGYPCIVKPKDSPSFVNRYRRKVFHVETEEELKEKVAMCHRDDEEVVIQRIIPGPETNCYCYDAYLNQESKVTHWASAYKIRQWPNHFGASTSARQKYMPELHELYRPFLEGIGYKGFAEIECKRDEVTGDIYLIEVNVRTINFNEMLHQAGINFPLLAYKEMIGEPIETIEPRVITEDTGLTFHYMYEDIFAVASYLKNRELSLGSVVKEYLTADTVPSTWSWDDPKPGIYFTKNAAKRLVERVSERVF